ncbi:MAG: TonB family protein [Cryobacterium sp.]|nr:TonB family protein [Oligoflexia bacterium]
MGAFLRTPRFFAYSLFLHAGFFVAWCIFATRLPPPTLAAIPRVTLIELESLPKRTPESSLKNQVVQSERANPAKLAAPNAFLGERTQTTSRETVSAPKVGTAPQPTVAKASPDLRSKEKQTSEVAPPTEALITSTGALAKYGIAISANSAESPKPEKSHSIADAAITAQVRGEYVKGFKPGEETVLNTREFVFYGYFQRIRERLDREWDKSLRERLTKYFYRGRQLASEQDYTTQLLVALDPAGRITKVQIIGASGTRDLDDAAIKAFNDAGPFPNPPSGLVDVKGQVLVSWNFVLKT